MELFPYAIDMLGGEPRKIKRYIGSFYETKFPKDSVDIVFLMQSFHHADKPFQLLVEIGRILKISGCAIIVGEPNIKWNNMFRRFLSELIKKGKLHTSRRNLFPPDPVLGDHYWRPSEYRFMAEAAGFSSNQQLLPSGELMYILKKVQ